MPARSRLGKAALSTFFAASCVAASDGSAAIEILTKNCAACHGAAQISGLDLRKRDTLLKGGKRGPAIVPGHAEDSLLLKAVQGRGDLVMPPGKQKLTAAEVSIIAAWIASGAPWTGTEAQKSEPSWWSFRKPVDSPVPKVGSAWVQNPIDAFILSKLESQGLHPTPPADPVVLARRVYFDMTGLPPTPQQIKEFVEDRSPDAWPKLVDRLLASPQYGEAWGRHWLDVVRYAESGGFETDIFFPNAWRYRDYVIKSFNQDKPYNRFVQEQVAGDELWPDTLELEGSYYVPKQKLEHLEAKIATGLYSFGPVMHESALDGELLRSERLADMVEVTGAAFLGLTVGCARCHDHKFDPIRQKDYFRLAAVFAGSDLQEIPVVNQMFVFDYYQAYPRIIAVEQVAAQIRRVESHAKDRIVTRRMQKFSPEALRGAVVPKENRTRKQEEWAVEIESAKTVDEAEILKELTGQEKDERDRLIRKLGEASLNAPRRFASATVLGHTEIVPDMHVQLRGDFRKKGEKVGPGVPAVLSDGEDFPEPSERPFVPQRRKALASWLASPDNPLTARVMVNRIWQGHFGRGIVGTPNDFGRQGDPPSHPELLDWFTTQFVKGGWSMKSIHRLILLSNTYRMSSRYDAANAKIDPANRLLWRMNRHRLEAEQLRDSMLVAAGNINYKAEGPSVVPPLSAEEKAGLKDPSQWPVWSDPAEYNRRTVYMYVKRAFRMPMLETFDMPETSLSCERRNATTVAPQALTLLNSEFSLSQAKVFAERLQKLGPDRRTWVDTAWQSALGRLPSDVERKEAVAFLDRHQSSDAASNHASGLAELCLMLFNMNEFIYVD